RSTKGLLGPYNKDSSDDFLPRYSEISLPHNSSLHDIHWKFGITWIVGSPEESLFTYDTGRSWATYYDPYFTPNYNYSAHRNSTDVEEGAVEVCEGDRDCLFYAALTGRVNSADATNDQANLQIREILELMVPIVCDFGCENGACVSNTCYCGEGFSGQRCTQRGECSKLR
ncbi:Mucin-like protein (Fragment), partial [Geodia barretti]